MVRYLNHGQKAPNARRCIKTPRVHASRFHRDWVRKHRAPKGALRHQRPDGERPKMRCQIAPSTKRCIKTRFRDILVLSRFRCQKAPSAKRCIKTRGQIPQRRSGREVRKHRAPKGALRRLATSLRRCGRLSVRKHRAPKGALRPRNRRSARDSSSVLSQKAPSAKRCIKTGALTPFLTAAITRQKAPSGQNFARNSLLSTLHHLFEAAEFQRSDFKHRTKRLVITCNIFEELSAARTKRHIKTGCRLPIRGRRPGRVRKHRAPDGALRPAWWLFVESRRRPSESTERQKVH